MTTSNIIICGALVDAEGDLWVQSHPTMTWFCPRADPRLADPRTLETLEKLLGPLRAVPIAADQVGCPLCFGYPVFPAREFGEHQRTHHSTEALTQELAAVRTALDEEKAAHAKTIANFEDRMAAPLPDGAGLDTDQQARAHAAAALSVYVSRSTQADAAAAGIAVAAPIAEWILTGKEPE